MRLGCISIDKLSNCFWQYSVEPRRIAAVPDSVLDVVVGGDIATPKVPSPQLIHYEVQQQDPALVLPKKAPSAPQLIPSTVHKAPSAPQALPTPPTSAPSVLQKPSISPKTTAQPPTTVPTPPMSAPCALQKPPSPSMTPPPPPKPRQVYSRRHQTHHSQGQSSLRRSRRLYPASCKKKHSPDLHLPFHPRTNSQGRHHLQSAVPTNQQIKNRRLHHHPPVDDQKIHRITALLPPPKISHKQSPAPVSATQQPKLLSEIGTNTGVKFGRIIKRP